MSDHDFKHLEKNLHEELKKVSMEIHSFERSVSEYLKAIYYDTSKIKEHYISTENFQQNIHDAIKNITEMEIIPALEKIFMERIKKLEQEIVNLKKISSPSKIHEQKVAEEVGNIVIEKLNEQEQKTENETPFPPLPTQNN